MIGRRKRIEHIEEDPTGLSSAVADFNRHIGPARVFFNRNSRTFYTRCYASGADLWWGRMCNGIDYVEIYRKTSEMPNVTVTREELENMESEIGPYSVW